MSCCLNPQCQKTTPFDNTSICTSCGNSLLLGSRYRALKIIGQGGFGRTFLAVDESHPSKPRCVIKQFLPPNISTLTASELFREEAERLKSLGSHPQIPTFLDYLEIDEQRYIIQEFIDGSNLEQELEAESAFNEDQIRQLLEDILPVLEFVHDHSVIHRDIKPENIIRRSSSSQMFLVDFGASKYATGTALVKTGTTIGTAGYTAPEQLMGKAVFQSDLYSLGVTCVHLLTQVPPFDLVDSAEGSWVWRDYLNSPVNEQLGSVLDKLLERGTRRRYTSASSVLDDLISTEASSVLDNVRSAKTSSVLDNVRSIDLSSFKNGESLLSRSKLFGAAVGGIVGLSALAGMGYVAMNISQLATQTSVTQAPQPHSRLTPVPQIQPKPEQQTKPKFAEGEPIEKLTPVIKSFSMVTGMLAVVIGVGIGVLDYSNRGDYQRGANIVLFGILVSMFMNILWNTFTGEPSSVNSTSIVPILPQQSQSLKD